MYICSLRIPSQHARFQVGGGGRRGRYKIYYWTNVFLVQLQGYNLRPIISQQGTLWLSHVSMHRKCTVYICKWPLQYNSCVLITRCLLRIWRHWLPKHPTSLFRSAELVPRLFEVWGKTADALFAAHIFSWVLRASTCSMFNMLSKMMVLFSATVVQPGSVAMP